MSTVIDEKGRLFGYVNIIDLLALLLVIAFIVAGAAFVTGDGGSAEPATTQQQVTFTAEVSPEVAAAMENRPVTSESVVSIDMLQTDERRVWSNGEFETVVSLQFTATLVVTPTDNGLRFEGDRLLIGEQYRLDLGYTILEATAVDWQPVEGGYDG